MIASTASTDERTGEMAWIGPFGWFGAFAIAMLVGTWVVLPRLVDAGVGQQLAWFCVSGPVFAAMLVVVAVGLKREGVGLRERLRLRPLARRDLRFIAAAFALTGLGTGVVFGLAHLLGLELQLVPAFFADQPLGGGELWLLVVWLPVFVLNIFGEELLWRGLLLPRQEQTFGRHAWLANAAGWLAFHVCFGWSMMLVLMPMIFAQAWACQRSGNTSVGIAVHGIINGAGFVAVTLVGIG
jgi:membrane protease YdiL (CAAX protease family)